MEKSTILMVFTGKNGGFPLLFQSKGSANLGQGEPDEDNFPWDSCDDLGQERPGRLKHRGLLGDLSRFPRDFVKTASFCSPANNTQMLHFFGEDLPTFTLGCGYFSTESIHEAFGTRFCKDIFLHRLVGGCYAG